MPVARLFPWNRTPRTHTGLRPWCQSVDLTQRRDTATGNRLASISVSFDGLRRVVTNPVSNSNHYDKESLLWLDGSEYRLELDTGGNADTSSASFTINLGESYLLACVSLGFRTSSDPNRQYVPKRITIEVSPNGSSWTTVAANAYARPLDSWNTRQLTFPAIQGQYVRATVTGIHGDWTPLHIVMRQIGVYASIFQYPAMSVLDGLPAADLMPMWRGQQVLFASSGPSFADGDWYRAAPDPNDNPKGYVGAYSGRCWVGTRSGRKGSPVTDDARQVFDLQEACPILGVDFRRTRAYYHGDNVWDFGCKIEGSDNRIDGPWTELYDTDSPFDEQFVSFIGDIPTFRYVRVTNKHGTYPSTTYDRFVYYTPVDVTGQTGCGLASMCPVPILGAPSGTRPKKGLTVHVGPLKWLGVQLANNSGVAVKDAVIAAPVVPGSTVHVTIEGDDHKGNALSSGTYHWRVGGSEATWEAKTAVGSGGGLADQPYTDYREPMHAYGPGRVTCSCVDGSGRTWIMDYETEGGGGYVVDSNGNWLASCPGQTVVACAADSANLWLARHGDIDQTSTSVSIRRGGLYLDNRPWYSYQTHSYNVVASGHNNTDKMRQTEATSRDMRRVTGLAVQKSGTRLFFSDHVADKVVCLSKNDLSVVQATAKSLTNPLGLAVDPRDGHVWVCHSGDTVTCYPIEGDGTLGAPVVEITTLNDPSEVAVCDLDPSGSHNYRLLVLEFDGGNEYTDPRQCRIREYDINTISTPTPGGTYQTFGTDAQPGAVSDTAWFRPRGMSIDNSGNLLIGDDWCYRVLRFRYSDGACFQRSMRPYGFCSSVDPSEHTATTFRVWCGGFVYECNPDAVTWTPLQGGLLDGKSRLAEFWLPSLRTTGLPGKYHSTTHFTSPGGAEYLVAMSLHSGISGFSTTAFALSEPGGVRMTSTCSMKDLGVDLLGSTSDDWNGWQAKDADGSGGLFDTGEKEAIGQYAYWFSSVSQQTAIPGTGRVWVRVSPDLISGGAPPAASGKKLHYVDPAFEEVGSVENAVYDIKRNLVGFTTDANLTNPFGEAISYALIAQQPDGTVGLIGEHTATARWYISLFASDGTKTWSIPTETHDRTGANYRFLYADPESRFLWESGTGDSQAWLNGRETTYGIGVVCVGYGMRPWSQSWADYSAGSCVFDFHGRTMFLVMDNVFGQAHLYEAFGLDTVQTDTASFAWVDLDTWDEGDAPEITFAGTPPGPGGFQADRRTVFQALPGVSPLMEF
jgi:hypothetical protein